MRNVSPRYYLSAMPSLGALGSAPPLELSELRMMVADLPWAARMPVDAVLLHDDLTQRESFLSGESAEVFPSVLTVAQASNEAALPDELVPAETESSMGMEVDRLWESYFRYVAGLAEETGCGFLREWLTFEVGLRNALARARAQRLGLAEEDFLVATDLNGSGQDFGPVVDEWSHAANPLVGARALLAARWEWVLQNDAWFSFANDELAAYAVKLLLLHQAWRLVRAEQQGTPDQPGTFEPAMKG